MNKFWTFICLLTLTVLDRSKHILGNPDDKVPK